MRNDQPGRRRLCSIRRPSKSRLLRSAQCQVKATSKVDNLPVMFPYLYQIVRIHCHDAKPQNPLLPRHASSQLQQRYCKSCLRKTLTQQSQAGARVDEDVHSRVPHGAHIACGELGGDDDVVNCEDQLYANGYVISVRFARLGMVIGVYAHPGRYEDVVIPPHAVATRVFRP